MQIAAAALVCGLAIAILLPAPLANEDRLLAMLLGTVCCATLLMGVLALAGVLTGTALLAAGGAAIMVPCAWLARAPEAPWEDEYDEEEDDGGGSPPFPRDPSPSHGPNLRRPAPSPAALLALRTGVAPPPTAVASPQPALAAAALRAELAPNPCFPHLAAPGWGTGEAPAPVVVAPAPTPIVVPVPPVVVPAEPPAAPDPDVLPPAAQQSSGEHHCVDQRSAPPRHAIRRHRPARRLRMLHGWRRRRWFGAADARLPR
jgi:hypothetical protein